MFLSPFHRIPFFEKTTLEEYLIGVLFGLGIILFFYVIKYFTSSTPKQNSLDFKDENIIVSPFLLSESSTGALNFSVKRNKIFVRIVAIILLLFLVFTPLSILVSPIFIL